MVLAMVMLVGCVDSEMPPIDPPRGETGLEWCDEDEACTLTAPVGASCSAEVTPFCADGRGWCSDEETCRQICSADSPRCGDGEKPRFEWSAATGSDVCFCVAD